jgi:hypothetical protein
MASSMRGRTIAVAMNAGEWIKEPFDIGQVAKFSEPVMNQSNGLIEMPL